MESIIRNLVKEEVGNALKGDSLGQSDQPPAKKIKTARTALRLNKLVTKINKKCSSSVKQLKPIKIQLRWQNSLDGVLSYVKQEDGGGNRFIILDGKPTFTELYNKAKIFFCQI